MATANSGTGGHPPQDLTGFQRDLLTIVAGMDKPNGLEIKDELGEFYEGEIHHGRLYPNLDTLVDKGLVAKGQADRRTNTYETSRRGERVLEASVRFKTSRLGGDDE